jgi:hypothetical protein
MEQPQVIQYCKFVGDFVGGALSPVGTFGFVGFVLE